MANEITILVNGETREILPETRVTDLLVQLGLHAGRVAIEYNLRILPRTKWQDTRMAAGDRLEIVQFVGGG